MSTLIQEGAIPSPACTPGETTDAPLRATRSGADHPAVSRDLEETETYKTVSGQRLKLHPLARLMPPMPAAEFDRLKESIREAKRNLVPIVVTPDNEVLDGLHRLSACNELDIEPVLVICDDDASLVDLVLDLNERRRRLNDSQRSLVAARLATLPRGRPGGEKARIRAISQEQAAEKLGVSKTQVQSARAVLKKGDSGLIELVERGKLAVSAAAVIAELSRTEQLRLVEEGPKSVRQRAAELRRVSRAKMAPIRDEVRAEDDRSTKPNVGETLAVGESVESLSIQDEPEATKIPGFSLPQSEGRLDDASGQRDEDLGIDPPAVEDIALSSEDWLAGLSLGQRLHDRSVFDVEARFWYESRPIIAQARVTARKNPAIAAILNSARTGNETLSEAIARVMQTPHPNRWSICPACQRGDRASQATCSICEGKGFQISLEA